MNFEAVESDSDASWFLKRVRRHAGWLRTEGVARLVEEDDLNIADRLRRRRTKRRWAANHGEPGQATAVFVVGLQRSGTNLVMRLLDQFPETEVHNENSRAAFARFQLKEDDVVREVVARSPHRLVVFKPLMDSHRVEELIHLVGEQRSAKAIWMYRDPDSRARSAVAKFGSNNLEAVTAIAQERSPLPWQAEGLSEESLRIAASFDSSTMSPEAGAMLMWYIRNAIFFEQHLDQRDDVLLLSYETLTQQPTAVRGAVLRFLDLPDRPDLFAEDEVRAPRTTVYENIPLELRRLCGELQAELDESASRRLRSLGVES
jgi:hypothetical protein